MAKAAPSERMRMVGQGKSQSRGMPFGGNYTRLRERSEGVFRQPDHDESPNAQNILLDFVPFTVLTPGDQHRRLSNNTYVGLKMCKKGKNR